MPIMVTGGFRSASVMNGALASNVLDMVGLGRPLIAVPNGGTLLLNGTLAALPSPESDLKLGPAFLQWILGPGSPFGLVRMIAGTHIHFWYIQIFRMGDGLPYNGTIGSLASMLRYVYADRLQAGALKGIDCNGAVYNPTQAMWAFQMLPLLLLSLLVLLAAYMFRQQDGI
jgi:hypothetical protein